jgi:hypothetical protein
MSGLGYSARGSVACLNEAYLEHEEHVQRVHSHWIRNRASASALPLPWDRPVVGRLVEASRGHDGCHNVAAHSIDSHIL